ncbi:MurR/RpiR family transcriptional regulator [Brachybacterium sp. EF45031]|uniref:MurR/RpiR family transcriptional regulator n=1 Tax=Brachybacterium sillae TaxID=2810536 RepID=UPI00217EB7AE|nr:MurR/RpiR family transcriptional regulator [Brachybacterium sillae]MCS6712197.1 MurR/RpiR family transcriptional regulator [Brachybacterium sillae]
MTAAADAPVTVRLRSLRDDLQPALQRLADVILADPPTAAGMTISELAESAGCSEATVVRFAHELGYTGYRDLRFRLHDDAVSTRVRGADGPETGDIDPDDDLATVVGKIAAADSRAVLDTARALDLASLEVVAEHLRGARRIVVVGAGASALAAADLGQKLARIGLPAHMHLGPHDSLPAVALLGPQDAVVALSHSGRTEELVTALRIAGDQGAFRVAITGSAGSPLARRADQVLITSAQESAVRSGATASRIAQLTAVDCVFVAVAQGLPDLGREALRRTRTAVESLRLP